MFPLSLKTLKQLCLDIISRTNDYQRAQFVTDDVNHSRAGRKRRIESDSEGRIDSHSDSYYGCNEQGANSDGMTALAVGLWASMATLIFVEEHN